MIAFLIQYRTHIALILMALGAFFYVRNMGYQACESKYLKAQIAADERARIKQDDIREKSKEVEDEVRKEKGANVPASPYLRGVLERLSNDAR